MDLLDPAESVWSCIVHNRRGRLIMSNWKAVRVGLNSIVRTWAGLPYRALVRQSWVMSTDDFWNYQAAAFRHVYEFARSRVPFYQKQPDTYPPMPPSEESVLEFLTKLSILRKQTVREYNSEFWADPLLPLTKFHTTSGTTGTPLQLSATLSEKGFVRAVNQEWLLRICGNRNPRTLYLSGFMTPSPSSKKLFWTDWLSRHVYLSIYSLNATNRDRIISLFGRLKPQLIYGYASAVYQLALLLGRSVRNSKDERIAVVTSEVLLPHWRTTIEASLCSRLYDYYSSQERCYVARQCAEGRMHINPLIGIIEIVGKHDEPVKQGETGRIVVTGLVRRSMPLIRYEIGDMAESAGYASDCPCGLKWPTIGPVGGRAEDLVKTRDGRCIGMLSYAVMKDLVGIKEAQIVQKGYEKFVCNIVRSETDAVENDYLEETIESQMVKRLQLDVDIEFRYLPAIPRTPQGKFKAVVVDFEGDEVSSEVRH
jgi:phenylacetate-CoA ligase